MAKVAESYCYIDNEKITVLTGDWTKGKINVTGCYTRDLEEGSILNGTIMNNIALQNCLQELFKESKISTKNIHLVINGANITVRNLNLPAGQQKNYVTMIKNEFRDMENIKDMVIDYSITNMRNEDGTSSLLVAVCPKEFLKSYIDIFREAKLELSSIDIIQNALHKLMANFSNNRDKTFCVMLMDKTSLLQILFTNNCYNMVRRSRILSDPNDSGFEREIGQNINSMIQFTKSEQMQDISNFYMCGFPDSVTGLFANYEANFGVQVGVFPQFLPNELTFPQNVNPSKIIVPMGGMIRYSN